MPAVTDELTANDRASTELPTFETTGTSAPADIVRSGAQAAMFFRPNGFDKWMASRSAIAEHHRGIGQCRSASSVGRTRADEQELANAEQQLDAAEAQLDVAELRMQVAMTISHGWFCCAEEAAIPRISNADRPSPSARTELTAQTGEWEEVPLEELVAADKAADVQLLPAETDATIGGNYGCIQLRTFMRTCAMMACGPTFTDTLSFT